MNLFKGDYNFFLMFVVLYVVKIVYICVFRTCSTSCCLCDSFLDPWIVLICMCV